MSKTARAMMIRIPPAYAHMLREQWQQMRKAGVAEAETVQAEVLGEVFNLTMRWDDRVRDAEKTKAKGGG